MDLVAADTQGPQLRADPLSASGRLVGVGPLSGWNVKCCKDEQLFFTALCSFIRKKKSIHIFSYTHLAALGLWSAALHPAREAQPCSRTGSPASRRRMQTTHFALSSQAF